MKKTYLFWALREGVVAKREFACWCSACMQTSLPDLQARTVKQITHLHCPECESPELVWQEKTVDREDAAGVANARTRARVHARALASQLTRALDRKVGGVGGVWIAVQNRGEEDPDQYWIGKALSYKVHSAGGDVEGTGGRVRYDIGDLEVQVQWYTRDVSGGDERRTFQLWKPDLEAGGGGGFSFNSVELRAVGLEASKEGFRMDKEGVIGDQVLGVVRRSVRAAAGRAQDAWRSNISGVARVMHEERAEPPATMWIIPAADENVILGYCCP